MTIFEQLRQEQNTRRIQCIEVKPKHDMAELRLMAEVKLNLTGSLPTAVGNIKRWMEWRKMGNNLCYHAQYVIVSSDTYAEIWHVNANGDRDRHLCTLKAITP